MFTTVLQGIHDQISLEIYREHVLGYCSIHWSDHGPRNEFEVDW